MKLAVGELESDATTVVGVKYLPVERSSGLKRAVFKCHSRWLSVNVVDGQITFHPVFEDLFVDDGPFDWVRKLVVVNESVAVTTKHDSPGRALESVRLEYVVDHSQIAAKETQAEDDARSMSIPAKITLVCSVF